MTGFAIGKPVCALEAKPGREVIERGTCHGSNRRSDHDHGHEHDDEHSTSFRVYSTGPTHLEILNLGE
jgi:hypothetical protein